MKRYTADFRFIFVRETLSPKNGCCHPNLLSSPRNEEEIRSFWFTQKQYQSFIYTNIDTNKCIKKSVCGSKILDSRHTGFLGRDHIIRVLKEVCGVELNGTTAGQLFHAIDAKADGDVKISKFLLKYGGELPSNMIQERIECPVRYLRTLRILAPLCFFSISP